MKHAIFASALLPLATPLWADTLPLAAPVTAATLYSEGATVTRSVPFTSPAGSHELLITNLPASLDPLSVRVSLDGVTLGAVAVRHDRTLPNPTEETEPLRTAKADLEAIEDRILELVDARTDVLMRAEAAKARLAYLSTLQGPSDTAASPETLTATLALIGQETLTARRDAATANRDARAFDKELEDLGDARDDAVQTIEALTPTVSDNAMLAIAITAAEATEGTLTLTHLVDEAAWAPVYDIHLDDLDDPTLLLKRGAFLFQETGEDWHDVALTLSTGRPNVQNAPRELFPDLRYIQKPPSPKQLADFARSESGISMMAAAPVMEKPVMHEMSAGFDAGMDGITATYSYAVPVSLTSNTDELRISLDTLELTPTVYAMANPMRDTTAFLMAEITNNTGEMILPGYEAKAYLNGTFMGEIGLPLIAKGADFDFPFGAIDGIQLTDVVTDRLSGDTGVITTRNEQTEARTFTAKNLTNRDWDLRLIGQVPYSEQEDLVITYQATPTASQIDYDDLKGVLMWDTNLRAGASFDVDLSHKIQWPTDMELR